MRIEFTPEQSALRDELRAYFNGLMTDELRAECTRDMGEGGGPLWREALQQPCVLAAVIAFTKITIHAPL